MLAFVFCGENSTSVAKYCYNQFIQKEKNSIMFLADNEIIASKNSEILFVAAENIEELQGFDIILVLCGEVKNLPRYENIKAIIFDELISNTAILINENSTLLMDCGLSQRATITISSIGNPHDSVCIQRTIKFLGKILAEPSEVIVTHAENTMSALFYTAINLFGPYFNTDLK